MVNEHMHSAAHIMAALARVDAQTFEAIY